MIPSFHLLHEPMMRKVRPGPTSPPKDPETGLEQWTIEELIANGKGFRFVDNPWVDYAALIAPEEDSRREKSPFTKNGDSILWPQSPTVAVVGAGMAGLLTAYQLMKAGFNVTVFEATEAPGPSGNGYVGAGRIKPTLVRTPDPNGESYAELGAMRFPSTSILFWHYLKLFGVAAKNESFTEFPNVAKVPSLFTGETHLSGVWNNGGLSLPSDYAALNQRHVNAFMNWTAPAGGGYPALSTKEVKELLSADPDQAAQRKINWYWKNACTALYGISYKDFLKQQKFSDADIEKIGYMGLGTGGFAPLFDVSALDIFRLVLWGYSAEFSVPELKQLPKDMVAFLNLYPDQVTLLHQHRVDKVGYSESNGAFSLKVNDIGSGSRIFLAAFDFVVLSMTHVAAQKLLSDGARLDWEGYVPEDTVCPFYDVNVTVPMASNIRGELERQQGMAAVKVFQTIAGPAMASTDGLTPLVSLAPKQPVSYDSTSRAAYGTFQHAPGSVGLGVTYLLPLRKQDAAGNPVPFAKQTYVNSLEYSWGGESRIFDLQVLRKDSTVAAALDAKGEFQGRETDDKGVVGRVKDNMGYRFSGVISEAEIKGDPITGFVDYFVPNRASPPKSDEGFLSIVVWNQVPYIWTGFKLDYPNIGSYLASAYATVSSQNKALDKTVWDAYDSDDKSRVHPAVKNLFFAGDSFSHYGGWVEGAFQSALATSAAVIRQAAVKAFDASWQSVVNLPAIEALVDRTPVPS